MFEMFHTYLIIVEEKRNLILVVQIVQTSREVSYPQFVPPFGGRMLLKILILYLIHCGVLM